MNQSNRDKSKEILKAARDATLVILADLWPATYLFIEMVADETSHTNHAGAMMYFGILLGEITQIWRSVKAVEGESFVEELETASRFSENANFIGDRLKRTHINDRPRNRQIAGILVSNRFVAKANSRHAPTLATEHFSDLEEFHLLVLAEASSRKIKIARADRNYPPPGAGLAPLQRASKVSLLDLLGLKPTGPFSK